MSAHYVVGAIIPAMAKVQLTIVGILLIFAVDFSATEITSVRLRSNNTGVVEVMFNDKLATICYYGNPNTWGKREANVVCRQLQFEGGWPLVKGSNNNDVSSQHLNNFDCGGSEAELNNCGYDVSDECIDSKLAGVQCYRSFKVKLVGEVAPNTGEVEVEYDDVRSNVCFELVQSETRPWSFTNVQVVCRELGFPGAMFVRQGARVQGNGTSILGGFKCKEDLKEHSIKDCLPDPPMTLSSYNSVVCNAAVALCAVPGYIGCFNFNGNAHLLHAKIPSKDMTINRCRKHCRINNYTLAYLQKGDTCFCGDGISDSSADDTNCRQECTGDGNQICGDIEALSVFNVTKGFCDHPLNGTGLYYYGDRFNGFVCKPGEELVGPSSIQCVMGDSSDEMKWSDALPECHTINQWSSSAPTYGINNNDNGIVAAKLELVISVSVAVACVVTIAVIAIAVYLRKRKQHKKNYKRKHETEEMMKTNKEDTSNEPNEWTRAHIQKQNVAGTVSHSNSTTDSDRRFKMPASTGMQQAFTQSELETLQAL